MNRVDIDKLAEDVVQAYAVFDMRFHEKGLFPSDLFRALFDAVLRYIKATTGEPMVHRSVAGALNGLREILELKSPPAPGKAIADADRMECMLFSGYDPHFEGDEPPGL